jgi:hypothetical protein
MAGEMPIWQKNVCNAENVIDCMVSATINSSGDNLA